MPSYNTDPDSTETPTILGNHRTNPYTISNMQQVYNNLGLGSITVTATNQYVRFLPNSPDQLSILDSIMEAQNLELFDAPMDYDVTQEGDYYQDPSIPDSSITWQYAVVPTSFQFPSGIAYQILAQIHIPSEYYMGVEVEAERLASVQDSIICSGGGPSTPYCGENCHWDVATQQCVCCAAGYHWDDYQQMCVPDPLPPPPPPPPPPDAQIPAGNITVTDNNFNTHPGVRQVKLIAKRWFKIDITYTDDNNTGHFQFTKKFRHRVKIIVKFKNNYASIRTVRTIRLWQMLYAIKKTIGVYSGDKNTITYNFDRYNTISANGNRYWVAATIHNAVVEHRDFATQFSFLPPPTGLKIYITRWASFEGMASTPLFNKRWDDQFPVEYISDFLISSMPFIGPCAAILRRKVDIAFDYFRSDITRFTSDFIKENMYHELSHASQYSQTGWGWYSSFVDAEIHEIIAHPGVNDPYNPYGIGTTSYSPIIALGEAWGYHMGHFLSEQRYGTAATCKTEQPVAGGATCCNFNFTGHPNADVLENFIPLLQADAFHWIPKGLMWDLMDNGEPSTTNVLDNVSGFSTQQIFLALQADVNTIPQYRSRLIQQNPGNQTTDITNLFASYGY